MRRGKLSVFLTVCLLSTTLPTSVMAAYTLDRDNDGVDIQDIVRAMQNPDAVREITGKDTLEKADVLNLLYQVQPKTVTVVKFGIIRGVVVDDENSPVDGAAVTLGDNGTTVQTNSGGEFVFDHVPVSYQTKVYVKKNNYTNASSNVFNIFAGTTINLDALKIMRTLGSVSGYVYGSDQHALASAFVSIDGGVSQLTTTDSQGYYFFNKVPSGSRHITVTSDTYIGATQSIEVLTDRRVVAQTFHLEKAADNQVKGSIVGDVKSTNNDQLSNVQVTLTGTTYTTFTDANGSFELRNIPAGPVTLDLSANGYLSRQISGITVTSTVYNTGTIYLSPTVVQEGAVSGVVKDLDQRNLADVIVTLKANEDSYEAKTTTDDTGSYRFNHVPSNKTYTLSAEKAGYFLYPSPAFTVNTGETVDRTLTLQQGAAVATEAELNAALNDERISSILLLNDIHMSAPITFTKELDLEGMGPTPVKLTAPYFTGMRADLDNVELIADVGNNEEYLLSALKGISEKIYVRGLGPYDDATLSKVIERPYFLSEGDADLTAYIYDARGLLLVLEDERIATIYLADHIVYDGDLFFPNRRILLMSRTEKLLQTMHYFNADQTYISNVRLVFASDAPNTAPPLLTASAGRIDRDQQRIEASANKNSTLYLVPSGTSAELSNITQYAVRNFYVQANMPIYLDVQDVPLGDYMLYAVDESNQISLPSDMIQVRNSQAEALKDLRYRISTTDMAGITVYDFISAGIRDAVEEQLDLYEFALTMDRDVLGDATDEELVAGMQRWVDIANDTPIIHRALYVGFEGQYDWSHVDIKTLTSYGFSGIESSSQLAVAEYLMEDKFYENFKLLTREEIQEAITGIAPSAENSDWWGEPTPQGPGTNRVNLRFSLKNAEWNSLKGYRAEDFMIDIDGEQVSLANPIYFSDFSYNDDIDAYTFVFTGRASSTTYTLANLSVNGRVVQGRTLSVLTPAPDIPVTSISFYWPGTRVTVNSSNFLGYSTIIAPDTATNKDLVWSVEPSNLASITQDDILQTMNLGKITVTATNLPSGVSKSMELTIVDQLGALSKVQAYALSGGVTELTLDDLLDTCVSGMVDDAFDNYKKAIVAHKDLFVNKTIYEIINVLEPIIRDYTSTVTLNRALEAFEAGDPISWETFSKAELYNNGVFLVDDTNLKYVKRVIFDTFIREKLLFGNSQLNALLANVPSFSVRSYFPTVYNTQITNQRLKEDESAMVITFKIANANGQAITGLTAQDMKATIDSTTTSLGEGIFSNFTELGEGMYAFEISEASLSSPILIETMTVRVKYTDIPIASLISINKQASLIEKAVANHVLSLADENLFLTGYFPSLDGLDFKDLKMKLELAYTAHGNELSEGTIRRIIHGMNLFDSYSFTPAPSEGMEDSYNMTFNQSVRGSIFNSMQARNALGYMYIRSATGNEGKSFDVTFTHTSTYPVALTYTTDAADPLVYSSDDSLVAEFELIFN